MWFRIARVALCAAALAALTGPAAAQTTIDELVRETGIKPGPVAMRDTARWNTPRKILLRGDEELAVEMGEAFPGVDFVSAASRYWAVEAAGDADAIIGWCDKDILSAATKVSWVQIFSAGADRCVPLDPIRSGDIVLTNMQKMSSPTLGEHGIAMVLALARGLVAYGKTMESGEWQRRGPISEGMQSVAGKTLLVAGLGGIGTETAKRGAALGMRVVGTRRSSREGPDYVDYVGLSDELHTLAGEADFIVNALPLTDETRGLFDAEFFDAAKRGAIFVSVGRGASTVTADLVAALESGQIAAAGLDVTDPEPLPADHPLWQMQNVVITPHVAGRGGSLERHMLLVRENIRRFLAGDALLNVVDPGRGY